MQGYKERPLSRHENQLRLLFMHADELIQKLEVLNCSADKLDHLEVMINGVVGAPGLIEVVESLASQINRVDRWSERASGLNLSGISNRLTKIEYLLVQNKKSVELKSRGSINVWVVAANVIAITWGVAVMGMLHVLYAHGMP